MVRFLAALPLSLACACALGCAAQPVTSSAASNRPALAAAAATHAQQRLMGTWAIELTPNEARMLQIAKLALDDGDRRAELSKLNPTPDERRLYEDIVTLSSTFDPRLEQIERKVKRAATLFVVTPERVEVDSGDDTLDVEASYAIDSESSDELVLRVLKGDEKNELVRIRFVDQDTIAITMASEKEPRRFVRRH